MTFRPLHNSVLVRRLAAHERTAGGSIASGAGLHWDGGKIVPPDVTASDRVRFDQWSGAERKLDGEGLITVKESDILRTVC